MCHFYEILENDSKTLGKSCLTYLDHADHVLY